MTGMSYQLKKKKKKSIKDLKLNELQKYFKIKAEIENTTPFKTLSRWKAGVILYAQVYNQK